MSDGDLSDGRQRPGDASNKDIADALAADPDCTAYYFGVDMKAALREIQRRRARDAGDAAARALAQSMSWREADSRDLIPPEQTALLGWYAALAAERKAERPGLLRVELNQALIDAGLFEAVPRGVPAIEAALRAYRRDHGSIDDALEREG